MYALANSGAEIVFHLGMTTSYALTEFVVFWRLNFWNLFRVDASTRRDNLTINKPCVYCQTNKKAVLEERQTPPCFFYFPTLPPLTPLGMANDDDGSTCSSRVQSVV